MKKLLHHLSFFSFLFFYLELITFTNQSFFGKENIWADYNLSLTFLGIALSFLSLADTNKENKRSKKNLRIQNSQKCF